jgi:replication-associated recombination protein RarA
MTSAFMLSSGYGGAKAPAASQTGLGFPQPLSEKYRPKTLDDFAGLRRPRAIFTSFARAPYESGWLLVGPSGTGKTTMALAFASMIHGEIHHIPSRECDLETVQQICQSCWYVPMGGGFHIVLVDEADQMSRAAQLAFLSKLDSTGAVPKTVFIFTANSTSLLEDRFISRCRLVEFTREGMAEPGFDLLARIWRQESESEPNPATLTAILEASNLNIREALMRLELELIAPGTRQASVTSRPAVQAAAPATEAEPEAIPKCRPHPAAIVRLSWQNPEIRARRLAGMRRARAAAQGMNG